MIGGDRCHYELRQYTLGVDCGGVDEHLIPDRKGDRMVLQGGGDTKARSFMGSHVSLELTRHSNDDQVKIVTRKDDLLQVAGYCDTSQNTKVLLDHNTYTNAVDSRISMQQRRQEVFQATHPKPLRRSMNEITSFFPNRTMASIHTSKASSGR